MECIGETLLVKREIGLSGGSCCWACSVPRNLAPRVFHFLARDTCKAFVEVTGKRVNRGAGYGLENPCTYRLYSPPAYIKKIDGLSVQSLAILLTNNY